MRRDQNTRTFETGAPGQDQTGRRYEQMLAHSATAAVCANAENLIVSWNTAAEELFGYTVEEAIGQPLSIIIPPKLRAAHDAGLARAVQTGQARLAGHPVDILALHADGSEIPVDLSLSMWFEDGKPMFGALLRDIADRHSARKRLEHLAHCDTLTSLPNRNALLDRLAADIARVPCSLLLLDLDGFKHVNDTLGHSVGDALLTSVAERLKRAVGPSAFVARLGGDEFAILLADCSDPVLVDALAKDIFDVLTPAFELGGQSIYVGTSIGIGMSPHDAVEVEVLLSCADLALYSAKANGGGTRTFFVRAMQNSAEQRLRLGSELRQALANSEFELWYQPQVDLDDGGLTGAEALLRWRHPQHGLLTPQTFMSVLEESAIAEDVGTWVIDQACAAASDWQRAGLGKQRVGVNLFAAQLRSDRLLSIVSEALKRHNLSPEQIELEITETTVLQHSAQSTKALGHLRALGVGVAFDDFGTGFASLSLLQKYPITRLKVDRSFVASIDREPRDAAIVKAVICMAQSLDLSVIAEGVETAKQEQALIALGCSEGQGFRYGRPMPASEIVDCYALRCAAKAN